MFSNYFQLRMGSLKKILYLIFQRRKLFLIAAIMLVLMSTNLPTLAANQSLTRNVGGEKESETTGSWDIECVNCPRYFDNMTERSLQLDSDDHPHIAYGGDNLYYAWHDGSEWHYEIVDEEPGVGEHASLALDASGHAHISYYDSYNMVLKYAHFNGISWIKETVMVGVRFDNTSLALDSSGTPHLCFGNNYNGSDLYYGRYDGSSWVVELLDEDIDDDHTTCSIAVDGSDHPHITYRYGIALKYAHYDGASWGIEVVDSENREGYENSLALDELGHPHIAYKDGGHDELKYAHHDGLSWQIEVVDDLSAGSHVGDIVLIMDSDDQPHIGYENYSDGYLKYANFDGFNWIIESFSMLDDPDQLSMTLDVTGQPHFIYETIGDLEYAIYDGSTLQTEVVDISIDTGSYSSLELDSNQDPHISYQYALGYYDFLGYTHKSDTDWSFQSTFQNGGAYTSLALDSSGLPHISYTDDHDLMYTHFDGSSWGTEEIEIDAVIGYSSLVLDNSGQPHISYSYRFYDFLGNPSYELRYGYHDGTDWQISEPTYASTSGGFTSLELDSLGRPHISFKGFAEELKFYYKDGSSWQGYTSSFPDRVDGSGSSMTNVGSYNSLALGFWPHISYLDSDTYDLMYAHFDGSEWQLETIDSEGGVGYYTSLALDSDFHPHISYMGNGNLKYAYFDGLSWHIETVDDSAVIGGTSIEVDSQDDVHISYYDASNKDLKYAFYDRPLPDLKAVKTNDTAGSGSVGTPFHWTITVSNIGSGDASFTLGETIIIDDLPSGGVTYGTPSITDNQGISNINDIKCEINSGTLSCYADANLIISGTTGEFTVSLEVTPSETGTLSNPVDTGICKVDPTVIFGDSILESDEANNECQDAVNIGGMNPTPTPTPVGPEIDVQGNGLSIPDGDSMPSQSDGTDFGEVAVLGDTVVHTFTIYNLGGSDLNLEGDITKALSVSSPEDFTVTKQPDSTIPSGGSSTFEITFDPSAEGVRMATITIPNNDSDEDPYDFAVQGVGVDNTFADVPLDHWAFDWIEALYNAGLTSGYPDGTYRPSNSVTRAEMAVFLLKGMNTGTYSPPVPDGSHPFSDIEGHWAESWMEELYDVGLTSGYPDATYRPQNEVTRAEMAVFLLRAKHGAGYSPPAASGGAFSDIAGHWAEGWIEQLADEGITGGYPDGTYRPNNPVNRAEMAVFLVRAFDLLMP